MDHQDWYHLGAYYKCRWSDLLNQNLQVWFWAALEFQKHSSRAGGRGGGFGKLFSVKGQIESNLGFASHMVSVAITQLCHEISHRQYTHDQAWLCPRNLYFPKWPWATAYQALLQSTVATPLRWIHSLICWKTTEPVLHHGRETPHPSVASSRFLVIRFSNLIKYSLFLEVRWLCVNLNIILQRAWCLRGQWEISQNALPAWYQEVKLISV